MAELTVHANPILDEGAQGLKAKPDSPRRQADLVREDAHALTASVYPYVESFLMERAGSMAEEILERTLGVTPELRVNWEELRVEMGEPAGDVLLKALNLLRIANEVTRDGQRLVAIDADDTITREIVGVVEPIAQPVGAA